MFIIRHYKVTILSLINRITYTYVFLTNVKIKHFSVGLQIYGICNSLQFYNIALSRRRVGTFMVVSNRIGKTSDFPLPSFRVYC